MSRSGRAPVGPLASTWRRARRSRPGSACQSSSRRPAATPDSTPTRAASSSSGCVPRGHRDCCSPSLAGQPAAPDRRQEAGSQHRRTCRCPRGPITARKVSPAGGRRGAPTGRAPGPDSPPAIARRIGEDWPATSSQCFRSTGSSKGSQDRKRIMAGASMSRGILIRTHRCDSTELPSRTFGSTRQPGLGPAHHRQRPVRRSAPGRQRSDGARRPRPPHQSAEQSGGAGFGELPRDAVLLIHARGVGATRGGGGKRRPPACRPPCPSPLREIGAGSLSPFRARDIHRQLAAGLEATRGASTGPPASDDRAGDKQQS
jgi:hypothetical protein